MLINYSPGDTGTDAPPSERLGHTTRPTMLSGKERAGKGWATRRGFYWRFAALRAGLRQQGRNRFFAFPALALQLAKLASGPCRATTSRPASRDWNWERRTVWNPSVRKGREGWGTHG